MSGLVVADDHPASIMSLAHAGDALPPQAHAPMQSQGQGHSQNQGIGQQQGKKVKEEKAGYVHHGQVTRIGTAPLIDIAGYGEMRFAYRNVRRRANEARVELVIGDRLEVRLQDNKVAGLRLIKRRGQDHGGCLVRDDTEDHMQMSAHLQGVNMLGMAPGEQPRFTAQKRSSAMKSLQVVTQGSPFPGPPSPQNMDNISPRSNASFSHDPYNAFTSQRPTSPFSPGVLSQGSTQPPSLLSPSGSFAGNMQSWELESPLMPLSTLTTKDDQHFLPDSSPLEGIDAEEDADLLAGYGM
eukprot:TRINITY_DN21044_c0_g1_i1.p1 TRINITY_DN21044_c0_g1~~TRINITY_DN21044_c0_g1_i1.p1  ORF type:complete len:296 (+),score=67.28 TRINITY_DN21044_c0_g1_i1:79-966(+)